MASIASPRFPTSKSSPLFSPRCSVAPAFLRSPVPSRLSSSVRFFNPGLSSSRFRVGFEIPAGFMRGEDVETDELRRDVRDRAMEAIDACGRRVTVGDVASRGGLKLYDAEKALQALAADTGGFLEVSDEGDVLYIFARNYQSKLAVKSFRMRIEPLLESAKGTATYLIRIFFGSILITSIILVFSAIAVIATGSSDGDGSWFFNFSDLFCFCTPTDGKKRIIGKEKNMSFAQLLFLSVFSFVFGNGDPNKGIQEKKWKLIGQYIASRGGVVTKEELVPYLDASFNKSSKDDESCILPVLLQFDGHPEVDDEGNVLYCFLSLQKTAVSEINTGKEGECDGRMEKFLKEEKWRFSETNKTMKSILIGLGAINLSGVIIVTNILKSVDISSGGLVFFVSSILPLLQVYAAIYLVIPIVRWFILCWKNAQIEHRNGARERHAQSLERPDLLLRRKLSNAKAIARQTMIGRDRIVYNTGEDVSLWDPEARNWDLRFEEFERSCLNK